MTTLTQYLFFLDSRKNLIEIKPKRGTFVEDSWAQELKSALFSLISANTAISKAIVSSFANEKNQVLDIKIAAFWIRVDLIFLKGDMRSGDQLIVSFTKADRVDCYGSGQFSSEEGREEFYEDLTHEMRTSLNIVLGNSRLIKTSPRAEQKYGLHRGRMEVSPTAKQGDFWRNSLRQCNKRQQ